MSDQVAEIKSKVDIASLIGERIQLKQHGRRFLALCPFHAEKTPSFTVSPELGIFKCFGCGAAGDVFTFLERYEGMSFVESLECLADRVGVKLERRVVDSQLATIDRQIFEVNHLAAEYFHFLLTKHKVGDRARQYLAARNVSQVAIDHYFLGYAPARWDSLLSFLIKKGYKPELLEQAGLTIKSNKQQVTSNKYFYDRFRGRVMFPLRDTRGQVVGFSGRLISENPSNKQQTTGNKFFEGAKYINSPETPVYHKGKHLFGIFENKEDIRKDDRVVLVEGELDAISSWQASVQNVVAVKGTALTEDQVKLVRRFTRNVTIALDGDSAGWNAVIRGLPVLESQGMNVRVAAMPEGSKDPDDCARHNPTGWRDLVRHASNIYEALITGTITRIGGDTGEQKKAASEILMPILSGINNVIEQDHWIREVARSLRVQEVSVRRQMEVWQGGAWQGKGEEGRRSSNPRTLRLEEKKEETVKKTKSEVLSHYLLALLVQLGISVPEALRIEWLEPVGIQKIISNFKAQSSKSGKIRDVKQLRESLPEELRDLFDDAALASVDEGHGEVQRTICSLEKAWVKRMLGEKRSMPEQVTVLTRRLKELQETEGSCII